MHIAIFLYKNFSIFISLHSTQLTYFSLVTKPNSPHTQATPPALLLSNKNYKMIIFISTTKKILPKWLNSKDLEICKIYSKYNSGEQYLLMTLKYIYLHIPLLFFTSSIFFLGITRPY